MNSKEWASYKLGDLCQITSSKRIFSEEYVNSGVPFYRSKEIIEKALGEEITECLFIPNQRFNEIKIKFGAPKGGDVLLSSVGNRSGIPYIVKDYDGDFYFKDGNLTWFRGFNEQLNSAYLLYWLRSPLGQNLLNSIMIGSAQKALTIIGLSGLPIRLPPLPTQRRIADILFALDEKIELNRQTNATLESIAHTIFKEWFFNFNFPGATGLMQESELGSIPQGWRVAVFEDELDSERGLSYKGAGLQSGDAMPMHNLNSVYEGGGYKFDGIKYYSGEYKEKHIVRPGDLIVTNTEQGHKYMLIGYPAIVPSTFGEIGIYSHHIYCLRPKPHSYLTVDFVYQLLLQPEIREQVIGFANGTTVNMLKIEGLRKPKFVLPPKELVVQFSELARSIRLRHEENINQSATLAAVRDTLLPKLMSGEVSVKG